MNPTENGGKYRIRGLDGLRAIAVILVFLQHKTRLGQYDIGSYGVWLFFSLSGFLIVDILHKDRTAIENGLNTPMSSFTSFMTRRAFRIFPIYYLVLLSTLPLFLTAHTESGRQIHPIEDLFNFAYLSNIWIGNYCKEWVGPYSHLWSLSIEEQFYVASAIVFLLIPAKAFRIFCAAICAIGIVFKTYMDATEWPEIAIYTNSFVNFAYIAYGGLCALTIKRHTLRFRGLDFIAPALLLLYICLPFAIHSAISPTGHRGLYQYAPVIVGPLFMCIYTNQAQVLVKVLEIWPLKALGRISYGVYLYHNLIGNRFYSIFTSTIPHTFGLRQWDFKGGEVILSAIATIVVATASWHFVEQPLLNLQRRGRPSGSQAPTFDVAPQQARS